MSEGRDALKQVLGSVPYKTWAKDHRLDANKVSDAMEGKRVRTPSSAYARGLVRLAKLNPPPKPEPPAPPEVQPAHGIWLTDGIYVRRFSNFGPRAAARAAGFRWLLLQLDHSPDVQHNLDHLAVARQEGWVVGGWATFGQGTDPKEDGKRHANLVRDHGLALWAANGELWAEGANGWKSEAWWDGWDSERGTGPVALSCLSSTTANYGRSMDWRPWVARRCSVQPQVYGASNPAYSVDAMKSSFARTLVPAGLLAPTFDVIDGDGPFADYKTWQGPRSLWTGDDSRASTYANL